MITRDTILEQVRQALGRPAGTPPAPVPPARIVIPEVSMEERIAKFCAALEKLSGKPSVVESTAAARAAVEQLIAGQRAVASGSEFLQRCGIDTLPTVRTRFADRDAMRAELATAPFGITSADYVLADTGSLVMISSPQEARLVSLLPPVHIAVVPRERILTGLDELMTLVPRPGEVTSSMVLITGPSRTADIEQILVRGVHGPGEIHVIVV